ncbi:right-handed parallel beta-helix repeat-containing protein, partial [Gloeocapsa sp. PCC 73106]|uniref:right-handed parallel beta-helix repeat-containing protein n=1 Tax=Gloeocapsa sp. PCC 73106 TaxID=102232 RepID=UPI0002AD18D1
PGDSILITAPGLEALADNGGPTLTHALQADSPAVNNGINALIPPGVTTDQRGNPRIIGPRVDIGAFESDFTEIPPPTVALNTLALFTVAGGEPGIYRLVRSGNTDSPLDVQLTAVLDGGLSETDVNLSGVTGTFPDYSTTFAAGESFVDIALTINPGAELEGEQNLTLNIIPEDDYRINATGSATIGLLDPSVFIVTNTQDSGAGSLRQAIINANGAAGNQTISFEPALAGRTIALTSGELIITDGVIIDGLGAEDLTIDAGGNSQVITINGSAPEMIEVELEGLTITGGSDENFFSGGIFNNREKLTISNSTISDNTSYSSAGGIFSTGELIVNNSQVTGNTTRYGTGGGISSGGELIVNNSQITDNTSLYNSGGGIAISSSGLSETTINNSTISGNVANNEGGGIDAYGVITINNSTISGNTAGLGGGVDNGRRSTLYINNSTFSGNSATYAGGLDNGGNITINNSTITDNFAPRGAAGISSYALSDTNFVKVTNSIISGNGDLNNDISQRIGLNPFISYGNNIIGSGQSINAFNQFGDAINISDPGVQPLADNGGPTQTRALRPTSPAINAGNNQLIPEEITTDQRGEPRIQQNFVDIGAFESNLSSPSPLISLLIPNPIATEGGLQGIYRVSRTGDPTNELTINLTGEITGELNPSDFNLNGVTGSFPNYTVTIPAGEYGSDITLIARRDREIEFQESLTLSLEGNPEITVNNGASRGTVTIVPETILVTNSDDMGIGSLREAIFLANEVPGENIIQFDASLTGEPINLTSGAITITDDVTIQGLGADQLTIDGGGVSEILNVNDSTESEIEVSISNLSITGSRGPSFFSSTIVNNENLTITNTNIFDNQSRVGIENENSGKLSITNSTISGNSGSLTGGILNNGELSISNSTISGNTGSGINNRGTLSIGNSTITLNQADEGGGIINYSGSYSGGIFIESQVTVANTIISGNLNSDVDLFSFTEELTNTITSSGGNLIGTGNGIDAFTQPNDQT